MLDKTKTAMGARALRSMIEQPLINKEDILKRQAGIEECNNRAIDREEIREYLNPVYDLERIMTKISCKSANPRDLIAFRNSLEMLPHIKKLIGTMESDLFADCFANLDDLADIYSLISSAIVEEPPITIREAGIIKEGFSKEADELRRAKTEGKEWLAQLEAREKEATGIKNLKVKYNKVFGYYLEVTNSFKDLVPADWVRLTPAGISVYKDAKFLLSFSKESIKRAKEIEKNEGNLVRVALSPLTPTKFLGQVWPIASKQYPDLRIQLVPFENEKNIVWNMLSHLGSDGQVDIVVATYDEDFLERRNCTALKLRDLQLSICMSSTHKLAQKEKISIEDLVEATRRRGGGYY